MKKKHKKILIIGPFPDPISGVSLANKVVREVLIEEGYQTHIIDTSFPDFEEKIGNFSFKKLWFYLRLNVKSYTVFKYNTIYFTPGQTFFGIAKYTVFIVLAYLLRKEMIIHVHGNHVHKAYESLQGVKKKIYYFLMTKFSKGIVLSTSLKKNLTTFLKEDQIYVLPNFAEDYLSENAEVQHNNQQLRLVYLSNLMEEKGILILLEALKVLEEQQISYEARIAGNIDAKNATEIDRRIKELNHTRYVGVVKGKEKKELLDWANVFTLPTFYTMEGQPISIIEALATGNVIVTTAHAGIPDIITEQKHGFFVKKESVDDLVTVFKKLSKQPENIQTIRANNQRYFLNNFTIKKFKSKLVKIIQA